MDREILATLHWRKPGQHRDRWRPQRRDTAGEFQPSSLSPWDQTDDFHLWRNIVCQFSEEFLTVWLDHRWQTPPSEKEVQARWRSANSTVRRPATLRKGSFPAAPYN